MPRCGCTEGVCSCAISGTGAITVTGAGSETTPYVISFAPGTNTAAGCEQIMDCVGSNVGNGLIYDDTGNEIRTRLSTNAGNVLDFGTDGGLFATGVESVAPGYGWGTSNTITLTEGGTTYQLTPTLQAGTSGDFTISGNSIVLARAGAWWTQCIFRFASAIDETATPPAALMYCTVMGPRYAWTAQSIGVDSGVSAISYNMIQQCAAGETLELAVQRSVPGWATNPTCFAMWSFHRLGPSLT